MKYGAVRKLCRSCFVKKKNSGPRFCTCLRYTTRTTRSEEALLYGMTKLRLCRTKYTLWLPWATNSQQINQTAFNATLQYI